jgi:DNA-binding transcriptional MerR regulator
MSTKLTQSALGRRLDVSPPRLAKAINTGLLKPDEIVAGRIRLFNSDRLESIRQILNLSQTPQIVC